MFNPVLIQKIARFAVVGLLVMVVFMALNWLLAPWTGKQVAFFIAYVPSVALHFCLNKWWTFGCERNDAARQISEYLIMVAVTFGIQWSVFSLLIHFTLLPSWCAAGAANLTQMIVSFLFMQRKVFAPAQAPRS